MERICFSRQCFAAIKSRVRFDETRAAWKRGDIAALSETNASLRRGDRQTAQRLLDRRNLRWLPRIEAEMKTETPTAIVAGAGHFSGAAQCYRSVAEARLQDRAIVRASLQQPLEKWGQVFNLPCKAERAS